MGARFVFRPGPVLDTPIRTTSDIDRLHEFDPAEGMDFMATSLRLVRQTLDGDLPLLGFAGAPLTLAFFLIEGGSPGKAPTRATALMQDNPGLLHRLLERLADMTADYLAMQIEAGADAVQLFESVADMVSPAEYEEFAHRYHVRIFSRLGARVPRMLFAKERPEVALMVESGADVLSVGSCVDLAEAKRQFGDRVAFQGNVDNRLLVSGSPEEIDAAVRRCVQEGGQEGHILNLNHGLLKETPLDNVRRLIETCKTSRVSCES